VKTAVVSLQGNPPGVPSFYMLVGRPQGKNETPNFNLDVMEAVEQSQQTSKYPFVLLNCANDGVSCDTEFVMDGIINFLSGKKSWVTMTDPNHNNKNFRYQAIGGSTLPKVGKYVLDADLLRLACVPVDLYRIQDFASDKLVLALASAKTVKTLMETEDRNVATLAFVLMFIRVLYVWCKLKISASTCPGNFHMVFNDLHYFHERSLLNNQKELFGSKCCAHLLGISKGREGNEKSNK
jgi:hypothetical protein